MSPAERARGVVAASAGNHAQGVALAANLLGTAATVYMPLAAPLPKIAATRAYGAEVRLVGATVDESLVAAQAYAAESGSVFIHPFDHPDVIAGQGTVGLEIMEQCPDARTVLVPTGGGGLISGIGVAIKASHPDVTIVAVQAEAAAAFPGSLAAGHPVPLDVMATMADGIAVGCPGPVTFDHVQSIVDDVVCVSEVALSRALLLCLERVKLLVEPAGVAAVAAILEEPRRFPPPVVAVLSGGNIDPVLLMRVIQHGMIAASRYLRVRVRVPDRRAGRAADPAGRGGRQRAGRRALPHRREAQPGRGGGRPLDGDPGRRPLRRAGCRAAPGRLPADVRLTRHRPGWFALRVMPARFVRGPR
jgi:threonine dehydratase